MLNELNHFDLWTGLFGGLALFLFGMDIMTRALKIVAGNRMKGILAKLTKNRFVGAATGAAITGIINSSSVTTVLLVGFVSAGLISMTQCVSVILGANIGSTMTAQILAFNVSKIALPMITIGFCMNFLSKKEKTREYGAMLLGLGMVFFGMSVMSNAMTPLRGYQPFLDLMVTMDNRFLSILIGAAFTAIIQSSAAKTGIVIVMAGSGLISLPASIAIAFGANIGTCATAGLAVIGKPREAVRTAVVHTLFNVIGVLLWAGFIPEFAEFITYISPIGNAAGLSEAEMIAAAAPRQIANAHTIFNIFNALLFIGFTPQIALIAEWLVPDKAIEEEEKEEELKPKYLSEELLVAPALAIVRCRLEIGQLGDMVETMFKQIMPAILTGKKQSLNEIAKTDDNVSILHGHIIDFLGKISLSGLTEEQSDEVIALMDKANQFAHIGDIIKTNLVRTGKRLLADEIIISQTTQEMLMKFHAQASLALTGAAAAVRDRDIELAGNVIHMKRGMARLATRAARHEAERLVADQPNRLRTYTREIEIVENLNHIFNLCRRIAKTIIETDEKIKKRSEPEEKPEKKIKEKVEVEAA